MEYISGPSEALSSEFRLQQKRLNRELHTITSTLTALQEHQIEVGSSSSSSSSSSSTNLNNEEFFMTLENLENKLDYLIGKEKETSLKAEEYLRQCNTRVEYFSNNCPSHEDAVKTMETDVARTYLADEDNKEMFPKDSELKIRNCLAFSQMTHCGDYLLRKGYVDIVQSLVGEDNFFHNRNSSRPNLGDFLDEEQFKSSLVVEAALRENDLENGDGALQLALGWCSQHGSRLRRLLSPLEFCLRVEQFIALAQSGRKSQAFTHIHEFLLPFSQEMIARMNESDEMEPGNVDVSYSSRARSGTETSMNEDDPYFAQTGRDSDVSISSPHRDQRPLPLHMDTPENQYFMERSSTDPHPRRSRSRSYGGNDGGVDGGNRIRADQERSTPLAYLASAAYVAANRAIDTIRGGSPDTSSRRLGRNRSNSISAATTSRSLLHRVESPPRGAWRMSREQEPLPSSSLPTTSSSIWSIPSRLFTAYFSSGNSAQAIGVDSNSSVIDELNALSAFERLLLCATSQSNASSTESQHVPTANAWCKFQSLLIEECLGELSSLLVLTTSSRTMKPFYGTSISVVEERRRRIADLFKSEAIRVFRLSWKPNLVTDLQLGAMAFKAACPVANDYQHDHQEKYSSSNRNVLLGALGAVENTRRQMWRWVNAPLGGSRSNDVANESDKNEDIPRPSSSSSSEGAASSSKQVRTPRSPRGKRRTNTSSVDDALPTPCSKCEHMYQPVAPPDEAYKVMRHKYCAECNTISTVYNDVDNSLLCPLCIPTVTGICKQVPVPSRVATSLRCRGTGERITEKSGRNVPMALPNGHVFSKKFIFDNSYLKLNKPGENATSKKFREKGLSYKEIIQQRQKRKEESEKKEKRQQKRKEKQEIEERRKAEQQKLDEMDDDEIEEPQDGRQFFDEKILDDFSMQDYLEEFWKDMPDFDPFEELDLSDSSSDCEKDDQSSAEKDEGDSVYDEKEQELATVELDDLQKTDDYTKVTAAGIHVNRWMEHSDVYFNCPITNTAYSLNTIRQVYIT